jgi:hypothetical protein
MRFAHIAAGTPAEIYSASRHWKCLSDRCTLASLRYDLSQLRAKGLVPSFQTLLPLGCSVPLAPMLEPKQSQPLCQRVLNDSTHSSARSTSKCMYNTLTRVPCRRRAVARLGREHAAEHRGADPRPVGLRAEFERHQFATNRRRPISPGAGRSRSSPKIWDRRRRRHELDPQLRFRSPRFSTPRAAPVRSRRARGRARRPR